MSTTPSRDELARTLRQLRIDARLTLADVAARAGVSMSTVSRLENGRYVPTVAQAEALAQATGARTSVRRRLVALASDLRERTTPRQVLTRAGGATKQQKFADIEASSGHVQTFNASVVLGLLQTADYARVIFSAGLPPDRVEDAVNARLARRRLLDGVDGPRVTQLMGESALRWHIGGPEVMADQCAQIAEDACRDGRVRVGIIPWTQSVQFWPQTGFNLYDERAAVVGTRTGTAYITARADVAEYVALFRQLTEAAVFGEEAASIARRIAGEYRELAATAAPAAG